MAEPPATYASPKEVRALPVGERTCVTSLNVTYVKMEEATKLGTWGRAAEVPLVTVYMSMS